MRRWLAPLLFPCLLGAQELTLQVVTTTDTHGRILPRDAYTLQPAAQGWARLATLIRGLKEKNPSTVLVDCGDTLQGEPVDYVRARIHPELPQPEIAVMNALGYNAMTVGNHDFDFGLPNLRQVQAQARFPWLSANTILRDTGKCAFVPHALLEVKGVRIAIVGFTTAATSRLADPGSIEGLAFQDVVASASALVPRLRVQEKADLVIVALHGGLGKSPCAVGDENQALCLADRVPGIDLILMGHTHALVNTRQNGVPLLQAGANGRGLGVAQLGLRKVKGVWKVHSCDLSQVAVSPETAADPEALELTRPILEATETYLDTFATTLNMDLDGRWSRMEDTALLQLIHTVQRKATGAQLSAASSPGSRYFAPRGPASVRQFFALSPYENRLSRIRVTGAQVRAYLEHSARFFTFSHLPDLFNRDMAPFDFDSLDGCTYALDISQPPGKRVVGLRVGDQPVLDTQVFTLAVTSYRLSGGGGYMEAIGFDPKNVEVTSQEILRNLILEHVLARPTLSVPLAGNWHIIPSLDRARILAQQP